MVLEPKLIPELNLLGKTYDVANGKFADPSSAKEVIINWDKVTTFDEVDVGTVTYRVPKFVDFTNMTETTFTYVSGESMTDYLENLTSSSGITGKYMLFTGSFSADFSMESAKNLANAFTRASALVKTYTLKLQTLGDFKKLREVLDADFIKAVNESNAAKFFEDYGTHMISSMLVGGRASFLYTTDSRKYTASTSIGVTAEMSSEFLMGKTDEKYKTAHEEMTKSSTYKVATVGGDPQYGNTHLLDHVQQWEASVKDYLRFIDFADPSTAYIPLWQLANTEPRKQELKAAMDKYLSEHQAKELDLGPYVEAGLVTAEKSTGLDPVRSGDGYLGLFAPDLSSDTYYLSQAFTDRDYWDPPKWKVLRIKEKVQGALAYPTSWKLIATHKDELEPRPLLYWRPVFSGPYIVLSDLFAYGPGESPPETEMFVKQFRGIHRSAVKEGSFGKSIEFSSGGSDLFWEIQDKEKILPLTWKLAGKYPAITPYALKKEKVLVKG